MVERNIEVKIKPGLQARQAALFVQEANRFSADVYLKKEERQVNAKSIMGVMSLAIAKGTTITLVADGMDEEKAIESLAKIIESDS